MPRRMLDHPSVWRRADMAGNEGWIRHFSDGELAEIGAAPDPASFPAALSRNARARMSETTREGIAAFRDRRRPRWAQDA